MSVTSINSGHWVSFPDAQVTNIAAVSSQAVFLGAASDFWEDDKANIAVATIASVRWRVYYDASLDGDFETFLSLDVGTTINPFGAISVSADGSVINYPDFQPLIAETNVTVFQSGAGTTQIYDQTFTTHPSTAAPWTYSALINTWWGLDPNPRDSIISQGLIHVFDITWSVGPPPRTFVKQYPDGAIVTVDVADGDEPPLGYESLNDFFGGVEPTQGWDYFFTGLPVDFDGDFDALETQPILILRWWVLDEIWIYQFYPPTYRWTVSSAPATYKGWWKSVEEFAGGAFLIEGGIPKNPRTYAEIPTFATGSAFYMGGSPSYAVTTNNRLIYARGGYTVGANAPIIAIFDGISDRELIRVPGTASVAVSKAVISMISAGGTIYFTTLDSGSSSSDWTGRVFELDYINAVVTPIGAAFTGGEVPYTLAWHNGRLWCGTNSADPTVEGKIYWFRPGIDTAWTADRDLTTDTLGGVLSMASFQGKLFVGTTGASGNAAKILARSPDGSYASSLTGPATAANNGFPTMVVYRGNLYASYWSPSTVSLIKKFNGSVWSTVYTGASSTLHPVVGLFSLHNLIFGVEGGAATAAVLLRSGDGTNWDNVTSFLPSAAIGIPVMVELRS